MTTPDSGLIDNALTAKLNADATLLSYCPNGVFWGQAPMGSYAYVVISLIIGTDVQSFNVRNYEDILYLIEARILKSFNANSATNIRLAAARIDALLDNQPLTVGSPPTPVTGYGWMTTQREERTREVEVDEADPAQLWYRRGGRYRVQMSVT